MIRLKYAQYKQETAIDTGFLRAKLNYPPFGKYSLINTILRRGIMPQGNWGSWGQD